MHIDASPDTNRATPLRVLKTAGGAAVANFRDIKMYAYGRCT